MSKNRIRFFYYLFFSILKIAYFFDFKTYNIFILIRKIQDYLSYGIRHFFDFCKNQNWYRIIYLIFPLCYC